MAYVEIKEVGERTVVTGPYNVMTASINPKLKSQGFRYNGSGGWEILTAKLTPIKRKNLMAVISPFLEGGGGDVRSESDKKKEELNRRVKDGLGVNVPYELKSLADSLGGIWDRASEKTYMPDKESVEKIREAWRNSPKGRIQTQILNGRKLDLGINTGYEHKDIADSLGGVWDPQDRLWYMPDMASKDKVREKIKDIEVRAQEIARKKIEDDQRALKERRQREGIVVYYTSSESKGEVYRVGETFKDRKTGKYMVVTSVKSTYIPEDGMSFGLMMDRGWSHTVEAKPQEDDTVVGPLREQESRDIRKSEALKEVRDLQKMFREKGKIPAGSFNLRGDRLLISDKSSIPHGGGSWFVIEDNAIWWVRNNGHDGDSWGQNNIQTGGAGAIGYILPYEDSIASRILELDAALA